IVYPDLPARVLVSLGSTLMHDREQPTSARMQGEMLQPSCTPVLRQLLRGEQRPGGVGLDARRGVAQRVDHTLERGKQPGVPPAHTLFADRILDHIYEARGAGTPCHPAGTREGG